MASSQTTAAGPCLAASRGARRGEYGREIGARAPLLSVFADWVVALCWGSRHPSVMCARGAPLRILNSPLKWEALLF